MSLVVAFISQTKYKYFCWIFFCSTTDTNLNHSFKPIATSFISFLYKIPEHVFLPTWRVWDMMFERKEVTCQLGGVFYVSGSVSSVWNNNNNNNWCAKDATDIRIDEGSLIRGVISPIKNNRDIWRPSECYLFFLSVVFFPPARFLLRRKYSLLIIPVGGSVKHWEQYVILSLNKS